MFRSRPIESVMTVAIPEKIVDCAKANVTVRTNRHSVTVLAKQSGRGTSVFSMSRAMMQTD